VLPDMLDCKDFINADEIAKGLSPLDPGKSSIEAGRIMITKINQLISNRKDFAFETTLATKSYVNTVRKAHSAGYQVTLVYFWLDTVGLAIERVRNRVREGGHSVPEHVIIRRYYAGISNLFERYIPICDYWMIFNNSASPSDLIAEGYSDKSSDIKNITIFDAIKHQSCHDKKRQ